MERHPSLDERFDPAVRVVEHDPLWAVLAEAEIDRLRRELGPWAERVEHVGSTAVPGLAAKPIIDLQLSVPAIADSGRYLASLERLGYLFAPDPHSPDYRFFAKPPTRPRSYHLHVCQSRSHHELRHLAVRDFLRTHDPEAVEYLALKRRLVAQAPADRLAYMAGKAPYLDALEARAIVWATSGS